MNKHPWIRALWFAVNLFLVASLAAVGYSIGWEYSTRSYLKGFSDAIIPASDNSEQKVEAILQWMAHGPARRSATNPAALDLRDPTDTLNIQQLLEVCGTATNAFVNLAQSSGLPARRLLLLDQNRSSKHVVVEVLIGNRWVVVDPTYHVLFRLPDGHLLTRDELKDSSTFLAAAQSVPRYPLSYTYESTAHVRLQRIPVIGSYLRRIFNFVWPSWEESLNWTLLLERVSFAALTASVFFLCFALLGRMALGWYCTSKLGIARPRMRDQILRAGQTLAGSSH